MDLSFLLEATTQGVHTVFKEFLLVIKLMKDIGILFANLWCLILYIFVERVMHCTFQLVKVINILDDPVDCSFEALDVTLVLADQNAVRLVEFVHLLLLVF